MTRILLGRNFALLHVFLLGGAGYVLLELLWRGRSHISMFAAGGLCCCLLLQLSRMDSLPFLLKCLLGGLVITAVEFAAGCVVNLWLDLGVWDYTALRYNLLGQISPRFTLMWCILSALVIPLLRAGDRLMQQIAAQMTFSINR